MCVILCLAKNQKVPFEKLSNAALNNPHGWGLVWTTDTDLEVFHKFDEKGNDPEIIAKKLDQLKDADMRYLHLRFATKGNKDRTNTHPFTVFKRDNHRIEFMHNGSLYKFVKTEEQNKSDTHQFAENYLVPLLSKFTGDNGPADLDDVILDDIIESHFNYSNRGLLISNILGPHFYGKWDTLKDVEGNSFAVSNTDYFDSTKEFRMTDYYKPKKEEPNKTYWHGGASHGHPFGTATALPAAQALVPTSTDTVNITETEKQKQSQTGGTSKEGRMITEIKGVDLRKVGRFLTAKDLEGLLDANGADLDDEFIIYASGLSTLEFKDYVDNNPEGAAYLLEHMFMKCVFLMEDNDKLQESKSRGEAKIIELKKELGYIPDKKEVA